VIITGRIGEIAAGGLLERATLVRQGPVRSLVVWLCFGHSGAGVVGRGDGYPDIRWHEADAASMSFDADRFPVTLSNLGHMYGDPPADAAEELIRVTAPGGHVGFTAWTLSSLYPTMAQTVPPYLSPDDVPDISNPPFLWGDKSVVTDRLEHAVTDLEFECKFVSYPATSPAHFLEETLRLGRVPGIDDSRGRRRKV
jgi:SAM-dependent methyltransferase